MSYLDFHSFVAFKRSCRLVWDFIERQKYLETASLKRKLASDWAKDPKEFLIPAGEANVYCSFVCATIVSLVVLKTQPFKVD